MSFVSRYENRTSLLHIFHAAHNGFHLLFDEILSRRTEFQ